MPHGCDAAEAVQLLRKRYEGRGVSLTRVGDAWAMRTAADLGFLMARETVETRKLSRAAIETLAIIAYHQPVTRAEIEEIRGVSASKGTVDQLIEMEWVRFGRRRMTPGRPVTYVVTQAFLDHFGLESARDLPGLKELREAGLLDSRPPEGAEAEAPRDGMMDDMFDDSPEAHGHGKILGGGMVGTHAGDMIGEIALAIEMGADAVDIGKTIHPHPTLGESIGMAAEVAHGSCTDLPPARK